MPFPSPEWIDYCQENSWLQEEWKPHWGDYFVYLVGDAEVAIKEHNWWISCIPDPARDGHGWVRLKKHIWLPTQHQLVEMLEEEGVRGWSLVKIWPGMNDCDKRLYQSHCSEISFEGTEGPCPEIALAECLKEVRKSG